MTQYLSRHLLECLSLSLNKIFYYSKQSPIKLPIICIEILFSSNIKKYNIIKHLEYSWPQNPELLHSTYNPHHAIHTLSYQIFHPQYTYSSSSLKLISKLCLSHIESTIHNLSTKTTPPDGQCNAWWSRMLWLTWNNKLHLCRVLSPHYYQLCCILHCISRSLAVAYLMVEIFQ